MAWWLVCVGLALALLALAGRRRDPPPIFGVYTQPGRWYPLKYAVFAAIYYFRKYAYRSSGAARAGQGVRALADPALMDRPQPLSDDPKAFDAVFFIAADSAPEPASDEGLYVMMGCERRPRGMCNGLFYIGLPGKGLLCSAKLPDTVLFGAGSAEFGAEGIRIAPLEPMKRWSLSYQGPMRFQKDPSREVQVVFSGEWVATTAHFDFDCDLHGPAVIRSIARERWSQEYFDGLKTAHQSHYEQFGTLSCVVSVDGEVLRFQLPAFRDHSFGARRDWALMRRYAFHHIFLADGTRAAVGVICQPCTATNFEVGVVALPDGRVLPARAVHVQLWHHGEGGAPPTDYGFSFQAGDQIYHVQADNTYFINKKGKYCSYCGRYTIRVSTTCPHCRANWSRRLGRCRNCEAAIDPEWSYCEICGVETARAQRLKRAKMLSHRAKLQKVAHTQLPPPPQHCPKSPDLFGPDPDMDEVESFESTLSSDQQSRTTPPTNSTNVSDDTENDVVADIREN